MSQPTSHLNALRAFEAAARNGSFARAATELSVSHTVISQHIRNLEAWLQTELFIRYGNRVELTSEARIFALRMSEAFQIIRESCDSYRDAQRGKSLNVCAEPAFATRWLRRRIPNFYESFPDISINLKSETDPTNLPDSSTDVVIHFEALLQPVRMRDRLFPIDGYPACSPEFLEEHVDIGDTGNFLDLPLVHDNGRTVWHQWFNNYAPNNENWEKGNVYSDLLLALDAATEGEGVFLADNIICRKEMESGELVKIDGRILRCTWYCAAYNDQQPVNPAMPKFRSWLNESASISLAASEQTESESKIA